MYIDPRTHRPTVNDRDRYPTLVEPHIEPWPAPIRVLIWLVLAAISAWASITVVLLLADLVLGRLV